MCPFSTVIVKDIKFRFNFDSNNKLKNCSGNTKENTEERERSGTCIGPILNSIQKPFYNFMLLLNCVFLLFTNSLWLADI